MTISKVDKLLKKYIHEEWCLVKGKQVLDIDGEWVSKGTSPDEVEIFDTKAEAITAAKKYPSAKPVPLSNALKML